MEVEVDPTACRSGKEDETIVSNSVQRTWLVGSLGIVLLLIAMAFSETFDLSANAVLCFFFTDGALSTGTSLFSIPLDDRGFDLPCSSFAVLLRGLSESDLDG